MEYDNYSSSEPISISVPTIITPDVKVPEDQDAITEFLQSRTEQVDSLTVSESSAVLDPDTFASITICCTIIICFFLILTRSR